MSLIGNSEYRGEHAAFSPSTVSWIHYSDERFIEAFKNRYRAPIGTEIHEWAAIQITLGLKCTSVRDVAKSIKTMIFEKYYTDRYGLSSYGQTILSNLKYIPTSVYNTVKEYVNDSISNFMVPEECEDRTDYSELFFGTCDALNFDEKNHTLKIFDLKTGVQPGKMEQLYIYAALFCLRNKVDPYTVKMDLRIYQNEEVIFSEPNPAKVKEFMDTITRFDQIARKIAKGGVV